jgi:hypothetical protein
VFQHKDAGPSACVQPGTNSSVKIQQRARFAAAMGRSACYPGSPSRLPNGNPALAKFDHKFMATCVLQPHRLPLHWGGPPHHRLVHEQLQTGGTTQMWVVPPAGKPAQVSGPASQPIDKHSRRCAAISAPLPSQRLCLACPKRLGIQLNQTDCKGTGSNTAAVALCPCTPRLSSDMVEVPVATATPRTAPNALMCRWARRLTGRKPGGRWFRCRFSARAGAA